jgi:hypothetical protein
MKNNPPFFKVTSLFSRKKRPAPEIIGWFGSITGLIGGLLLALNAPYSGWGFVAFLLSNTAWLSHGIRTKTWSLVAMQVGFTATSLLGVWRWML